jgi:hypothetical protein
MNIRSIWEWCVDVWWMYRCMYVCMYVCMFIYMYVLNVCTHALYAGASM